MSQSSDTLRRVLDPGIKERRKLMNKTELRTYNVSKLPIRDNSTGIGPLRLLDERFLDMKNRIIRVDDHTLVT